MIGSQGVEISIAGCVEAMICALNPKSLFFYVVLFYSCALFFH